MSVKNGFETFVSGGWETSILITLVGTLHDVFTWGMLGMTQCYVHQNRIA